LLPIPSFFKPFSHYSVYLPGQGIARNIGIKKAKGDIIAFIDADDLWPKNKLLHQIACFEKDPTIEIVQGLIQRVQLMSTGEYQPENGDQNYLFYYSNLGSMLIRKTVFDQIGNFDPEFRFHEDTDFWLRAREAGINIVVQRQLSLIYRLHNSNMTRGEDILSTGLLRIFQRSMTRRRNRSGDVTRMPNLPFLQNYLAKSTSQVASTPNTFSEKPLVSVILFAQGDSKKIKNALQSIIQQNYQPMELLVVGSSFSDFHPAITQKFERIKIFKGKESLSQTRNLAVENAEGEIVAFLDSDAQWAPNKLNLQVNKLISEPEIGYSVARVRHIFDPQKHYLNTLVSGLALRKTMGDFLGTMVIRKAVLIQVGEFRTDTPGMEDTDWVLRAKDFGVRFAMLPEVLLFQNVSERDKAIDIQQLQSSLLLTVRSSISRKRD